MIRAVIYARYSSHSQKDASIEQQLRVCRQWAHDHDIQILAEYCDHAISGTSDRRPEFLRMIKDSAKGRWDRVLVYKIDRFARNRYDSAMYKARLKKNGVKVSSVMEPIPDGPEGILLESVLEGSAEYYSANLSQNILRGMHDNALACKVNNGNLPLGLKKGEDGKYAIDPAGAAIVREIFELYANGANATEIINTLNSRGLRTSRGVSWNKNSLHTILRNERYIGTYIWKDVRIEDGIPAIISKELFVSVQERLKKVARAPAAGRSIVDYMLTGKLFCGHCGSAMVGESGSGKSGRKFCYYTCIKRKRQKACDKKPVKKDWIEEFVVRQTRERCLTDEMIARIVDAALELQERERESSILHSLEVELNEVNRGIRNMLNAIEQGIITAGTKQRLEELESRRLTLELAIEEEKQLQPTVTREQLVYWLDRFRQVDPSDPSARSYWSSFIDVFISAVYVYDDHLRIVCNFIGEGKDMDYPFVNNIENYEESIKVFGFDPSASTKRKKRLWALFPFGMGNRTRNGRVAERPQCGIQRGISECRGRNSPSESENGEFRAPQTEANPQRGERQRNAPVERFDIPPTERSEGEQETITFPPQRGFATSPPASRLHHSFSRKVGNYKKRCIGKRWFLYSAFVCVGLEWRFECKIV